MLIVAEYFAARRQEHLARLRRVIAIRAMLANGGTQASVAADCEVSQPAISQQLRLTRELRMFDTDTVFEAAAPVLHAFLAERGLADAAGFLHPRAASEDRGAAIAVIVTPMGAGAHLGTAQSWAAWMLRHPVLIMERGSDDALAFEHLARPL